VYKSYFMGPIVSDTDIYYISPFQANILEGLLFEFDELI